MIASTIATAVPVTVTPLARLAAIGALISSSHPAAIAPITVRISRPAQGLRLARADTSPTGGLISTIISHTTASTKAIPIAAAPMVMSWPTRSSIRTATPIGLSCRFSSTVCDRLP